MRSVHPFTILIGIHRLSEVMANFNPFLQSVIVLHVILNIMSVNSKQYLDLTYPSASFIIIHHHSNNNNLHMFKSTLVVACFTSDSLLKYINCLNLD